LRSDPGILETHERNMTIIIATITVGLLFIAGILWAINDEPK
jgi:cbb3-type cytochrome oxidase subunit 3